jgi:hypothetical protein
MLNHRIVIVDCAYRVSEFLIIKCVIAKMVSVGPPATYSAFLI